jgi:NAD(P)-dependent dehydrogenase (short-subunit alcohol dehydrogenase family)
MLLGKTIVITGISSGIGARVGELAQALGADIIGVDINAPGGATLSSRRISAHPKA